MHSIRSINTVFESIIQVTISWRHRIGTKTFQKFDGASKCLHKVGSNFPKEMEIPLTWFAEVLPFHTCITWSPFLNTWRNITCKFEWFCHHSLDWPFITETCRVRQKAQVYKLFSSKKYYIGHVFPTGELETSQILDTK